ncbi:cytochrome ubiquinol oxidase subunit I [Risungbinella massiliensis]|uniref:cytochrome ubiquinol oxidase subunit I n=1 Tax=Risungbinella massiliensis TaxID=1329796 RepID=UPI0005CB9B1C|nr:cytochrome ubiquinol oxidase subunit I [Risungbinella massiliensis]
MDNVTLSRAFFGTSLAFHIIFATLGVGLSLMVFLSEVMHIWKKDNDYNLMAKRWTKAVAILLGVAIPSGTIVGVQLSLLWPGFMKIVGEVISVPFQIEIYAFFLEALALSIYVYAADRLRPWMRVLASFLVAFGASASAILITSANTWMNTPRGFDLTLDGKVTHVDPWAAFFNPSFAMTAYHVTVSALMTGAFFVTTVAAYKYLRARKNVREAVIHRKALTLSLAVGFIMSLLTALSGHGSAQNLHQFNPEKLAAAEGLYKTQRYAPLSIGGIVNPETEEVEYGIEVPYMLSFLADNRFDTEVKGLYDFPKNTWPPAYVHILFNLMVGIGTLLLLLALIGIYYLYRFRNEDGLKMPKWLLNILVFSGPLSMLGIEFGWIFSCSGRQPWTIYGFQETFEAATKAAGVGPLFVLFGTVYLFLAVIVLIVLNVYFKKHPLADDIVNQPKAAKIPTA